MRYLEYLLQVNIGTSIIQTFRLSGWLPAQRGPDNPGSTVDADEGCIKTNKYGWCSIGRGKFITFNFLLRLQEVEKVENSWHHKQVLVGMESIHYLANSIVRL